MRMRVPNEKKAQYSVTLSRFVVRQPASTRPTKHRVKENRAYDPAEIGCQVKYSERVLR